MRCFLFILPLIAVICLVAAPGSAQTVTVYFDEALTQRTADCPGFGMTQTLYIAAEGFQEFLTGMEFKVEYPPSLTWVKDLDKPPVTIGSSPDGISMGYWPPRNGYVPVVVLKVRARWNCSDCSSTNERLRVVPHPVSGGVLGTRFPDYALIEATGQGSMVCQLVNLDIKPGSCPNPFNLKLFDFAQGSNPNAGGVLPVAIVGSSTFDVNEIDPASLLLEGVAPLAQGGGPNIADVATPQGELVDCQCNEYGGDGIDDLKMKFQAQDIAAAIVAGLSGEYKPLTMTGVLWDGTPFEATDCIKFVGKPKKGGPKIKEDVTLHSFPNPFNPVTRLSFSVPSTQQVHIAVYDVAGRLVDVLFDGVKGAGEHEIEWNAGALPSGVYFYRMTVGGETLVRRVTLLK